MGSKYHNVKTLQVELWENCSNNCPFCYLKDGRVNSTTEEQLKAIAKASKLLSELPADFEAFGIIGGEFFQGQLSTPPVRAAFLDLIRQMDDGITADRLKQAWVTASLIGPLDDFKAMLGQVQNKSKFFICTSYDTTGRFKTADDKQQWFANLKEVHDMGFTTHTQTICTQAFINEALTTDVLETICKYSMFDFKCPGPYRAEYVSFTGKRTKEWYRNLFNKFKDKFDPDFFITDRNSFFKFLLKVKEVFGPEKLEAFCSNEVRSDVVHLLPIGKVVEDRWDSDSENAPCGHPWDSFCYVNSDKCSRCDAQRLLDE